ncbi:MAG: hypothetical protein ACFB2Z_09230 [Maricaulaceae bacterium]
MTGARANRFGLGLSFAALALAGCAWPSAPGDHLNPVTSAIMERTDAFDWEAEANLIDAGVLFAGDGPVVVATFLEDNGFEVVDPAVCRLTLNCVRAVPEDAAIFKRYGNNLLCGLDYYVFAQFDAQGGLATATGAPRPRGCWREKWAGPDGPPLTRRDG